MESKNSKCYFCNNEAEIKHYASLFGGSNFVECPNCGRYEISCYYQEQFNCSHTAAFLCNDRINNHRSKIDNFFFFLGTKEQEQTLSKNPDYAEYEYRFITPNDVESWSPKNFKEKVDRILLAISALSKFDGDEIEIDATKYILINCCHFDNSLQLNDENIAKQLEFIRDYLTANELAEIFFSQKLESSSFRVFAKLLPAGLERVYQLQKDSLKQGFVAMWFPNKDKNEYVFMQDVRAQIKHAISDAGFIPQIIDEKEHNNQIVPELLYEIKRSRFLVADITGQRSGVYYEAGIMEGLGREVIVCCAESDFSNIHFDIAQKNLIKYVDANDLYTKLIKRIKATIDGANK